MNKRQVNNKIVVAKAVAALVLLAIFICISVVVKSVAVAELFSRNFSRWCVTAVGSVTSVLPFSLFEALIILAVFGVVVYIVYLCESIRFRQWKRLLSITLTVLIVVLLVLTCYVSVATPAYYREPLDLDLYNISTDGKFSYEEAVQLAESVLDEINEIGPLLQRDSDGYLVYPYDNNELNKLIAEQYAKLTSDYFNSFTPIAKPIVNSWFMSEMQISGISFLPTAEPNFNRNLFSLYSYPVVVAHEIAHSKGVMREGDANTLAYYITLSSEDIYVKYSGLVSVYNQAIGLVSLYPNSQADVERLYDMASSSWAYKDIIVSSRLWSSYTMFGDIGEFFNNIYLIFNGQSGTDSYVPLPDISDSGDTDDDGNIIWQVTSYSQIQNLLITLYKQGVFA